MTRPKAKGAARCGRPRRATTVLVTAVAEDDPESPPARPLTPFGSALLGALKAYMLHEVADDPEDVAEVEAAFAQLEAEDEALRSHGERVSDETTTRTSGTSKARERGGQKARAGTPKPKGAGT